MGCYPQQPTGGGHGECHRGPVPFPAGVRALRLQTSRLRRSMRWRAGLLARQGGVWMEGASWIEARRAPLDRARALEPVETVAPSRALSRKAAGLGAGLPSGWRRRAWILALSPDRARGLEPVETVAPSRTPTRTAVDIWSRPAPRPEAQGWSTAVRGDVGESCNRSPRLPASCACGEGTAAA